MKENSYIDMMREFAKRHPRCLDDLVALLGQRLHEAALDMIQSNDDNIMRAVRGEITICHEMIRCIKAARMEEEAEAKAADSGTTPAMPGF